MQQEQKKIFAPDFIQIPHQLIINKNLHTLDKIVYGVVYWYEHLKDGKCTASNSTIAQIANAKDLHSVADSLTRLEREGYIERVYKDSSKKVRLEIITKVSYKQKNVSLNKERVSLNKETHVSLNKETNNNNIKKNNKTLITNEISSKSPDEVNQLISLFKHVNPSYELFFRNKTQREAVRRLVKILGRPKLVDIIGSLKQTNALPYAPVITTPLQLESKVGQLIAFIQKKKLTSNLVFIP